MTSSFSSAWKFAFSASGHRIEYSCWTPCMSSSLLVAALLLEVQGPSISRSSCLNSLATNLHPHVSLFGTFFHLVCDDLRIFRQFFTHIKNSECFQRIKLFLLASQDGLYYFLINTFCGLVELDVISRTGSLLNQQLSNLQFVGTCLFARPHQEVLLHATPELVFLFDCST